MIYFQYKETYQSKIRDLCRRLKQQQHNFSAQEKTLYQRAEQAILLFYLSLLLCVYASVCYLSSAVQRCWLAGRKGTWHVKTMLHQSPELS